MHKAKMLLKIDEYLNFESLIVRRGVAIKQCERYAISITIIIDIIDALLPSSSSSLQTLL